MAGTYSTTIEIHTRKLYKSLLVSWFEKIIKTRAKARRAVPMQCWVTPLNRYGPLVGCHHVALDEQGNVIILVHTGTVKKCGIIVVGG